MKKQGIIFSIAMLGVLGIGLLMFMFVIIDGGFSMNGSIGFNRKLGLANTETISVEQVDRIEIDYKSDRVTFYKGDSEDLVLQEYWNRWDQSMQAHVSSDDGVISIKGGNRKGNGFFRYYRSEIKVYLPKSYQGDLVAAVTSGSLRSDEIIELKAVSMESNSGSIKMNRIGAAEINLKTSSGSIVIEEAEADTITGKSNSGRIQLDEVSGKMVLSTTSGSIKVEGRGYGEFKSSSGSVNIELDSLDGDLRVETNSGRIALELPEDQSFNFEANTTSGSIRTDFDQQLNFNKKRNSAMGGVGSEPGPDVILSASSGSIRVFR